VNRIVTLLTTSLRRCRYSAGLVDFLRAPQAHTNYLVGFILKRVELRRLPGAPVPAWQAISDRADKFREYEEKTREKIVPPSETSPVKTIAAAQAPKIVAPPKIKEPRRYTHNHQVVTAEALIDALAEWMYDTVTTKFNFTRDVCEHAKFQIVNNLLEPYQGKIAATSVKGLIKELCPAAFSDDAATLIGECAGWLLAVLLVFRQPPMWMCRATEAICGRALKREEEARYDGWAARTLYRSQQ
jgi:hypothetical protein